jgi:NAD(P)-dependent dehydrogenase (short-subunit alcohol dehydrogenase family)
MADARQAFNLRYWGALAAAKHAGQLIRPGGSIVLTTGIASLRPRKGWNVAASICGAMDALTSALAVEIAPIRVNAVLPGVVSTPLWGNMSESDRDAMFATSAPPSRWAGSAKPATSRRPISI